MTQGADDRLYIAHRVSEFRFGTRRVRHWHLANDACLNRGYALRMSREQSYGVAIAVVGFAAVYALQLGLRHFIWPAIAWSIFIMAVVAALAVVCNIVVVLCHMFFGYIPEDERRPGQATADDHTKMPSFEVRTHKRRRVA